MMIESATRPGEVHIMSIKGGSPKRLTHCNDALLKQRLVAKPSSHWITTPQGTKVHVWMLTPPKLKKARRRPGVLQVHGGPHGQYGCMFFHEFQCQAGDGHVGNTVEVVETDIEVLPHGFPVVFLQLVLCRELMRRLPYLKEIP